MKTSLLKKLYAVIVASIIFSVGAHAQIIYTDVKPDVKFSCSKADRSHQYNLDLNNDGINDFTTVVYKSYVDGSCGNNKNFSSGVNGIGLDFNQTSGYPLFSLNTIINDPHIYSDSVNLGWASIIWFNNCSPKSGCTCVALKNSRPSSDGYLGLGLVKGSNTYYGWVRLSVSISYKTVSFTVKDYAYNSIPNQPILAGETTCTTPTVTLNANGPLLFCAGDSVILTANGTGYLYQWKMNGVNIKGAIVQTYVAKAAGTYKCKVTNSCGSKISKEDTVIISCKGIFNNTAVSNEKIISKTTQLIIAPNPFSNSTIISFSLLQSQKVSLQIFDITGRLVQTLADAQMQAGTHQLTWNAKDEKGNTVNAGIYFLKMQAGNYVETKKLFAVK